MLGVGQERDKSCNALVLLRERVNVLAIDFSIHHHGCLGTESTARFPEVDSKVLSSNVYENSKALVMMSAGSVERDKLIQYLGFWKARGSVKRFDVVHKNPSNAIFRVLMAPQQKTVTKVVLDHNAVFLTPIPISNALERWNILLPEEERKSSLFSELATVGVIEARRIKRVDIPGIFATQPGVLDDLSPRQIEVLKTAFEGGYFEYPRTMSSRELARRIGIAQATVLEHLRKAQASVLQRAFQDL